jgi:hypothetical protein
MNIKFESNSNTGPIGAEEAAAIAAAPAPREGVPTLPSQLTDDATRLAVARKLLASEKNRVAVRGFEVARLTPNGDWEQVMKGKLPGMAATAKWLNERHPNSLYQVRVIVSAEIPDRPEADDGLTSLAEKMGVETVDGPPPSEQSTPNEPNDVEAPSVQWDLSDTPVE